MKLWTMLAGLVVAGIVTSSLYAQDAPKKGKRRWFCAPTVKALQDAKLLKDDSTAVTADILTAYYKSKLPADADDTAKELAVNDGHEDLGADCNGPGDKDAKSLKQADYTTALGKLPAAARGAARVAAAPSDTTFAASAIAFEPNRAAGTFFRRPFVLGSSGFRCICRVGRVQRVPPKCRLNPGWWDSFHSAHPTVRPFVPEPGRARSRLLTPRPSPAASSWAASPSSSR